MTVIIRLRKSEDPMSNIALSLYRYQPLEAPYLLSLELKELQQNSQTAHQMEIIRSYRFWNIPKAFLIIQKRNKAAKPTLSMFNQTLLTTTAQWCEKPLSS